MRRNWGSYKVLAKGKGYKVKLVLMKPECSTSLQTHQFRKEIWVNIDSGTVRVVEKGEKHKLANILPNKVLRVIEVQIGTKCVESDIKRY